MSGIALVDSAPRSRTIHGQCGEPRWTADAIRHCPTGHCDRPLVYRCRAGAPACCVLGLVTPNEIRQAERTRWRDLSAREVMRPLEGLKTVTPDTSAADALTTMGRDDVNQLPVIAGGRLAGMVTRSRILQLLESRMELSPSR